MRRTLLPAGRLSGSYTVEAALVISIVLLAVVTLVKAAYKIHDETIGAMALHETVEIARHREEGDIGEVAARGEAKAGLLMSWSRYAVRLEESAGIIRGIGNGGDWKLEIESERYDPENFMRMVSLLGDADGS